MVIWTINNVPNFLLYITKSKTLIKSQEKKCV